MKKIIYTLIIFFGFYINTYSQYLWPIKNNEIGEHILYKPQDYIDKEINGHSLFIGANKDDIVIAPQSGKIDCIYYIYNQQLGYSFMQNTYYTQTAIESGLDKQQRKAFANEVKCNPKFVSLFIKVKTNNNRYSITGIRPIKYLKTGSYINKGDTIGRVGFAYHKIYQPSIKFDVTENSKVSDPMTVFGLKTTFKLGCKLNKVDYLTHKHSPKKLQEDFEVFINSLLEGHPGLYDYITPEKLQYVITKTKQELNNPMTSEEFRLKIASIIAQIKDSHTAIFASKYKVTDGSKPPVLYGLKDDTLIIFSAINQYNHLKGKKILQIDNWEVKDIILQIKSILYRNDGYIQTVKERELFINFWRYYSLISFKKKNDTICFKLKDNSIHKFTYNNYDNNDYEPSLRILENPDNSIICKRLKNIAYLRINKFNLNDIEKLQLQRFIKNINDSLYKGLIIDVTNNSGGDEHVINDIYSYIAQKPWKQIINYKVNKKGSYQLFKHTVNFIPKTDYFKNYINIDNSFIIPEDSIPWCYPNDSINYKGKVIVLTNELSLSAATVFPSLVYKHKRGKIIGRETGSCFYHMNGLKFPVISLENTGLEFFLPLVKVNFEKKQNSDIPWGRGVIPHIKIPLSYNEFFGKDTRFIDTAIDEINKSKNESTLNNVIWIIVLSVLLLIVLTMFFIKRHSK